MSEKLFVLGHPVGHSKSPAMHNAAYRALGLDWEYGFADCATSDQARAFLAARDWLALNITMPYKPLAYACADERSVAADLAGGANVLVADAGGVLHADNTDGLGCVSYLKRCGVRFRGAKVVVCGTGPTSLAIFHACAAAGASLVGLAGRDSQRARRALEDYEQRLYALQGMGLNSPQLVAGDYAELRDCLAGADVIVDATSLGMNPGDPAPFSVDVLTGAQTVFDAVYGHGETALIAAARAAGCPALSGEGMLVAQAVETVLDIQRVTGAFSVPEGLDLFAVMAQAAGFSELAD